MSLEERGGTEEIYLTHDPLEVEIARGLLEDAGIEAAVRDLTMRAYPLTLGLLGEYRLLVPSAEALEARRLLAGATEDGVLVNGEVL